MIQVKSQELALKALNELEALQREIDSLPSYQEQVAAAVAQWPSKRQRKVFSHVEEILGAMCSGPKRCMFCEDNGAYQIEHFRPKSLYPGLVYAWGNYLFACGQCNGPKSDRFAIFSGSGAVLELHKSESEPESGPSVLLDPRQDDPMNYLWLDLRDTFRFRPLHVSGTPGYDRADYTLRWLGLNNRDELVEARRIAYENYLVHLERYVTRKRSGADAETLRQLRRSIAKLSHVTVWREMQRQYKGDTTLLALFEQAPEIME